MRRRLAALAQPGGGTAVLPFGIPALDDALPGGGLPLAGLHRLSGNSPEWDAPAAAGFALALARRLTAGPERADSRPLAWIGPALPYAPGLVSLGLDPARVLTLRVTRDGDILWALEEMARSGEVAVVIAQLRSLDRVAGRRLQLAAERGGTALLVIEERSSGDPIPAATRWRIGALSLAPSLGPLFPQPTAWQVELLQARGGHPAAAPLEWSHETAAFSLAAGLRLRAAPAGAGEGLRRRAG